MKKLKKKKLSQGQKATRPKNLDKRVFFCQDLKDFDFIHNHDLLYLHLSKKGGTSKFQWILEFDLLNSGNTGGSVDFTKNEFNEIAQICESRNFDWDSRINLSHPTSYILYKYSELDAAIEVTNKLADFAYSLYLDQKRRVTFDEISKASHQSENEELTLEIFSKNNGQFQLIAGNGLELEILLFKNGNISNRMPVNSAIVYETGYTRDKAIKESNPDRKDGVLLINHHIKKSEFYATDWNTFCLTVDRRRFTKSGEPINYVYKENVEQSHLEVQENNYSFDVEKQNLFPDEVEEFVNDLGVNKSFREGTTSQILVNAYERNPQARKKCIEHYGTSCFVCGFNFGKVFGQLGEGFIHVHHLKPISEIGQEYEINPIEDMRPVCPNCHAMIHRQTPLLSIEEIQSLLQKSDFYKAD